MSLKNGKVNPLNVLEIRKIEFPAHHFLYTDLRKYNLNYLRELTIWIEENLKGRYYIEKNISIVENNSLIYTTKVGFESEKELTFFNIACPHLK